MTFIAKILLIRRHFPKINNISIKHVQTVWDLSASDFNAVYVTDCLEQVVSFVNNNHVPLKSNAARLPSRLVQQRVVWQNDKL